MLCEEQFIFADICLCLQWCELLCCGSPWSSLCCSGRMWCYMRRAEQGWAGRRCFSRQPVFLWRLHLQSQRCLLLGLWITLCVRCHIALEFEHTKAQTPLLFTPLMCWLQLCTSSLKAKKEKWGGTGSDWAPAEPSLYGPWGCGLMNSCFPWARIVEAQETKLKPIWSCKNWTGQTWKGGQRTKDCYVIPALHDAGDCGGLRMGYWEWAALSAGVETCISRVCLGSIWSLRKKWG